MMSTDPLDFTRIICGIVVQMSWINSKSNTMDDHQFFSHSLSFFLFFCCPSINSKLYINKYTTNIYFHIFICIHAPFKYNSVHTVRWTFTHQPLFFPISIIQFFMHTWFYSSCSFGIRIFMYMYIFVCLWLCL